MYKFMFYFQFCQKLNWRLYDFSSVITLISWRSAEILYHLQYSKDSNKRTVCTLTNFMKKSSLYALIKDL